MPPAMNAYAEYNARKLSPKTPVPAKSTGQQRVAYQLHSKHHTDAQIETAKQLAGDLELAP